MRGLEGEGAEGGGEEVEGEEAVVEGLAKPG